MENAESDAKEAAVDKTRLKTLKTFHRVLLIGRQKCENIIKESSTGKSLIIKYKICSGNDIIIN